MNPVKTFTVMAQRWKFRYTSRMMADKGDKVLGDCQHSKRLVRVCTNQNGMDKLDTIIHEFTHAAAPWADEWFVSEYATDLARLLWRLSYRCMDDVNLEDIENWDG